MAEPTYDGLVRDLLDTLGDSVASVRARKRLAKALLAHSASLFPASRSREDLVDFLEILDALASREEDLVADAVLRHSRDRVFVALDESNPPDPRLLLQTPLALELVRAARAGWKFPPTIELGASQEDRTFAVRRFREEVAAELLMIPGRRRGHRNTQDLIIAECAALHFRRYLGKRPGYSRRSATPTPFQRLCRWVERLPNCSGPNSSRWSGPISTKTEKLGVEAAQARYASAEAALRRKWPRVSPRPARVAARALETLKLETPPWSSLAIMHRLIGQARIRGPSCNE